MSHHELTLYWLTLGFELALCVLVYVRNLQARLPLFSTYASVLLVGTLVTGLIYEHFGFRSTVSYYAAWMTIAAAIVARCGAIAELCRCSLQAYRGIWALTWRMLGLMTLFFFLHAALDARGQPNWVGTYWLTIERDLQIASVVILVAMLAIGDYYHVPADPLLKWIGLGIGFFCLVGFVNSTILRDAFTKYMLSWATKKIEVDRVNQLWNTIQGFSAIVSLGVWCYALRKPLPAAAREPELLPKEVYGAFSPAVNLRLRAFNDRLEEMLKP